MRHLKVRSLNNTDTFSHNQLDFTLKTLKDISQISNNQEAPTRKNSKSTVMQLILNVKDKTENIFTLDQLNVSQLKKRG